MRHVLRAAVLLAWASVAAAQQTNAAAAPATREGSGTSWQPDDSPMYAVHVPLGAWMLMVHDNAFLQYVDEGGLRGADQVGSINWLMVMAEHPLGPGRLSLRGMISFEPWTIGGCGYPDLLASGEICQGADIHDRQHPHDLPMEISASYEAPLTRAVRWQVYGGPAGEPALGPVAYAHRLSAMPNPIAPIGHHWLDSTHLSFGVVTAGVGTSRWKIEGSVFNGREPDEHRTNVDFGRLDSVSGRLWFAPTASLVLQFSGGHLTEAEASHTGGPRTDVQRMTASATYHRLRPGSIWATTVAWGRNVERALPTQAWLGETSVTWRDRHTVYARMEAVDKTPDELGVPDLAPSFAVSKVEAGYTEYFGAIAGFRTGIGAAVFSSHVPGSIAGSYGGPNSPGAAVYLTVRPGAMQRSGAAAPVMPMVQTALDPAKLSCGPAFDPRAAAIAMYQGRAYYFCSTADRDLFLSDPAMSLSMRPPNQ
jgi:YHS domain-containing protein